MASSNDLLVQRRRAAMAAKSQKAPTVEPAEVPKAKAPVQPLGKPAPVDAGDDGDDGTSAPSSLASPSGTAAVSLPMAVPADLTRQVEQGDLVMPKLKISQAMSKVNNDDVVRQGNWYHSTFNDNLGKSVLVVPVDMRKSRSYFVPGTGVMCRSFDLIQGEGTPGLACEGTPAERMTVPAKHRGCPLRLWGERDENTGRSKPPDCSITYNYPVLILDPEDMSDGQTKRALLSLRATGASVAKQINSIVTEGDHDWHDVVLELGLDQRTNTKGTFFVPTVTYVGLSSGATREKAQRFAAQVNAASLRASIEKDDEDDE
jgi:hypothetical protein